MTDSKTAALSYSVDYSLIQQEEGKRAEALMKKDDTSYYKYFVVQLCMWWFFSSIYSIEVKTFFKMNSLPLQATFLSLALSTVCAIAFMKKSELTKQSMFSTRLFNKDMYFVSLLHFIGTASTNYSISMMAVSFTHVVKAAEPVFTILWTVLLTKLALSKGDSFTFTTPKILSVLAIVGGVILASIMETSFSFSGLMWGLLSNVAFSGRNVLSKRAMSELNINKDALYLVLNLTGAIVSFILVLFLEPTFSLGAAKSPLFYSSLTYFMYTAISMNVLSNISPVSHAISNTCKRLIVFISSAVVFGTSMDVWSIIGALVTISGVAFYSVSSATEKEPSKEARRKIYMKVFVGVLIAGVIMFSIARADVNNNSSDAVIIDQSTSPSTSTVPVFSSDSTNTHTVPTYANSNDKVEASVDPVPTFPEETKVEQSTESQKPTETASVITTKPTNKPLIEKLMKLVASKMGPLFEGKTEAVILDHPDHRNRGDSAIYVGEVDFLEHIGVKLIYECANYGLDPCNTTVIKERLNPESGVVLMHGGGNFGDIYPYFENMREENIVTLKDYKVVMFPQTIFYMNNDNVNTTANKYATVPDLTIATRDQYSYDLVHDYFPTNGVVLSPDMAFMMGPKERIGTPKYDLIFVLRKDSESHLNTTDVDTFIRKIINNDDITFKVGDWEDSDVEGIWRHTTPTERANVRTDDALAFLSQGKVAVSDRLHSHILSTLLDIPHVCMDNFYGKVIKFHNKWMSEQDSRMVQFETELEDAVRTALKLLKDHETLYNN